MKPGRALILTALLLISGEAGGQAAHPALPERVDLGDVVRLVRERSPRLALARQGIAQAEADRITAGTYPNPVVSYGRFRPGGGRRTVFEGSSQQDATVELPLLLAGQRAARVARAEREIEAARARVAAGSSTLAAEAGAAYVALLAAQRKAALAAGIQREVTRLRKVVAGREAGGAASRYDVTRLEVELGSVNAQLQTAHADVEDRSGMLASLLGLPGWRPRAAGELTPLRLDLDAGLLAQKVRNSPASLAAAREEAAAQSAIDVARRERWPVPAVAVGRTWTSDPFGAANFLGLTVEIPLFDTRRGALARAQADAGAAMLRRRITEAEVASSLRRLTSVIAAREAALVQFEKDAARRLEPLKRMAEDAYRLRRGTVLELLDAARSRYRLQEVGIDLAAGLLEAQVRLLGLLGALNEGMTVP